MLVWVFSKTDAKPRLNVPVIMGETAVRENGDTGNHQTAVQLYLQ